MHEWRLIRLEVDARDEETGDPYPDFSGTYWRSVCDCGWRCDPQRLRPWAEVAGKAHAASARTAMIDAFIREAIGG
jgi:hypothetical protein